MSIPLVTIQGKVMTPGGKLFKEGDITVKLSHSGKVEDESTPGTYYRISIKAQARTNNLGVVTELALVPNTLITPSNTFYKAIFSTKLPHKDQWIEYWQLSESPDPIDIGEIELIDVPTGIQTGITEELIIRFGYAFIAANDGQLILPGGLNINKARTREIVRAQAVVQGAPSGGNFVIRIQDDNTAPTDTLDVTVSDGQNESAVVEGSVMLAQGTTDKLWFKQISGNDADDAQLWLSMK